METLHGGIFEPEVAGQRAVSESGQLYFKIVSW